ncbi:acetyl-CoA carboxylase biotin carboxylase subunit family protein [Streptomyces sp. NPDC059009]|uniref:ATP-grasp domain-containing protein n=1 Tax=Streptomyces sp. NPDC059009 TaxID=3346694 RepID=UPI0036BE3F80
MHLVLLGPQTEAIDELADLGHTLTVLYTERNLALVERSADRIALRGFVPSYDCPELAWSTLLHLGVADEVDAVIPLHEMAVVSASVLNRLLGLAERVDPRAAMAGRDKAFQKSLWSARGVPTARCATVTNTPRSLDELCADMGDLRGPYVVKPPALGGTRLVTPCASLPEVFQVLRDTPELRHAVIEERQPGDEWHFDGTLVDGRIESFMVSRYLAPLIETKSGRTNRSIAYPVFQNPGLYAEARAFAQSAVDALRGTWGVFHLEVFGGPGNFVAGELAWRPSGALASLTALHTIGVNLWEAHARLLAGEEVTPRTPVSDSVVGFACLPVQPGARNGIRQSDIEALEGVRHVQMKIEVGQTMGEPVASTVCVAMVLIEAPDLASLELRIEDACRRTRELHAELSG